MCYYLNVALTITTNQKQRERKLTLNSFTPKKGISIKILVISKSFFPTLIFNQVIFARILFLNVKVNNEKQQAASFYPFLLPKSNHFNLLVVSSMFTFLFGSAYF